MIIPRRDVCSFSHAGRLEPAERIVNPPSAPLYWLNRRATGGRSRLSLPEIEDGSAASHRMLDAEDGDGHWM